MVGPPLPHRRAESGRQERSHHGGEMRGDPEGITLKPEQQDREGHGDCQHASEHDTDSLPHPPAGRRRTRAGHHDWAGRDRRRLGHSESTDVN